MIITTDIERAQLNAVHDNWINAVNILQIAANNLQTLINEAKPNVVGISVADIKAVRDALTRLIDEVPPPPPPPPALVPLRDRLTELIGDGQVEFFDDFDSDTTINGTLNWYANPSSPEQPKPTDKWFLSWAALPGDYSVANSVLTINQDRSGDGGFTLQTVPYGFPDAGKNFLGSRRFEVRARWPTVNFDRFPNAGGIFWSFSIAHMRWQLENRRTGRPIPDLHIGELDFLESPRQSGVQRILMSIADWHYSARPGANTIEDFVGSFLMIDDPAKAWADSYLPGFDPSAWHIYGTSFKTAADNNGTGHVMRFVDGVHIPEMDVTWQPGGLYSILEDDARYLILGTGLNTPSQYDWVKVSRT